MLLLPLQQLIRAEVRQSEALQTLPLAVPWLLLPLRQTAVVVALWCCLQRCLAAAVGLHQRPPLHMHAGPVFGGVPNRGSSINSHMSRYNC